MDCIEPFTFNIISGMVPYVTMLAANNPDFPEAFCDVTSAMLTNYHQFPGATYTCGAVEGSKHIWVKVMDLNVDFTAHQFDSLIPYVSDFQGVKILVGTDDYFTALGYTIYEASQCKEQIEEVANEIINGEYGPCA